MDQHHHNGDFTKRTISPRMAFLFATLRIGFRKEYMATGYGPSGQTTSFRLNFALALGPPAGRSAAIKLKLITVSSALAFAASLLQTLAAQPETVWLSSLDLSPIVQGWGQPQAEEAVRSEEHT